MTDPATPDEQRDRGRLVYRWDLDKTYLRTEFDTIKDLLRTAFEPPSRKRTVPGAGMLLREVRAQNPAGIYILSGSPEQMRRALEAKLRLDGVQWDAFTLKPSLRNLLKGKFRFLRDQVSYKLAALMEARTQVDPDTHEILFGDDAEADAFIYSLYADIGAGRVDTETLMEVLTQARVYEEDIPPLVRMAERVPRRDAVERIFIHLDRMSPPSGFQDFGRRVCPFYNYFQPALVLLEDDALDASQVLRVGAEIVIDHAFSPDALMASFLELNKRGYVGPRAADLLLEQMENVERATFANAAGALRAFGSSLGRRRSELGPKLPVEPVSLDYVALFARDRARAHAAKRRAKWRPG